MENQPTLLQIENFPPGNRSEIGRVAFDAAAGQAVVKFDSVDGVIPGGICFIGRMGTESAEKLIVASVADLNVTFTTNLVLEHRRYQPVVFLRGDQIKVYRATNVDGHTPADSAFTQLPDTPFNIDPDQSYTSWQDGAGGSGYWYKVTYYNSITGTETALSDSNATRGGAYGHYASVAGVRDKAGFSENQNISNAKVNDARVAAENEINSELSGRYALPFTEPIPPKIREITELLAAGRLLNDEYGVFNSGGTSRRGDAKLKAGRDMLAAIKTGETVILDELLQSQAIAGVVGTGGWPNSTTADTEIEDGGAERMFRAGNRY